jgi:hypothetical protein
VLNDKKKNLGYLVLHSSSEVVLDRVLFGFFLIAITAIIKLAILFWLFMWAFDRYLAIPLRELMSQVDEVQQSQTVCKRIRLSTIENNELSQLQEHMNSMLSAIEIDRVDLYSDNDLILQHALNRLNLNNELKIVCPGLEKKLVEMPIFSTKIPAEKRQELIKIWNDGRLSMAGAKEKALPDKHNITFKN